MATHTPKTIAFIQLASSKGDIFAVPGTGKKYQVHSIRIHNTNTTEETVVINYHDGTNEYRIFYKVLAADETIQDAIPNEGLIIEAAGKLTGNTTTASKVTCWVNGTERAT